jgi:hypothetical protein
MPQCCREVLLLNAERSRRNRRLNPMFQILTTGGRMALLVLATTMFRAVVCADPAPTCGADLLTEKAVIGANERFQRSMIASDVLEMGRLLSSDFLYFTFSGEKRDRAELLRSYGAKEVRLKRYDIEDVRVRLHGSVGILTAAATKEGEYISGPRSGKTFTGRYRITRVYACDSGTGWQLVSTHESRAE